MFVQLVSDFTHYLWSPELEQARNFATNRENRSQETEQCGYYSYTEHSITKLLAATGQKHKRPLLPSNTVQIYIVYNNKASSTIAANQSMVAGLNVEKQQSGSNTKGAENK